MNANRKGRVKLQILLRWSGRLTLAFALLLLTPIPAQAYIGPGAGIAFVSSFFVILASLALALLTLLTWPFRWVIQSLRGRRALRKSRVREGRHSGAGWTGP